MIQTVHVIVELTARNCRSYVLLCCMRRATVGPALVGADMCLCVVVGRVLYGLDGPVSTANGFLD